MGNITTIEGQTLSVANDPGYVRGVSADYIEPQRSPTYVTGITAQMLTVQNDPGYVRSISAQYIEPDRKPASISGVTAQILTVQNDPGNVRSVSVQYIEIDIIKPDFTQPAWTTLLAALNKANGTAFTSSQLVVGTPEVWNVDGKFNTRVKVTARRSSGFSGHVLVFYPRWSIDMIVNVKKPGFDFTGKTRVWDMLPQVNTKFNLSLTQDEVMDGPVDAATQSFALVIRDGSMYFVPGSRFYFGDAPPLDAVVAVGDLSGFNRVEPPKLGDVIANGDLTGFSAA